ncbi:ABC transporter permease [Nesterenkonia sp. AN1]|uniref:Carbohydrate ABC transporter membrane protein 2 (CUT1 family) n=1 Tax=Nesterenkonia aurantiaca TaxID=1436010 RepID=A0A4R7G0C5_9MICC|nr:MULTISPECIES: sugar ABC transporter permease [Nesterenkonia]EXF25057.1 ABC transporter permease [Nesterenkonia sp. AN1]TDS84663.1 carbohydrate ABC transporter membrane protein 2 (CUT1 family) [Nesterenkonia aurantiaca]
MAQSLRTATHRTPRPGPAEPPSVSRRTPTRRRPFRRWFSQTGWRHLVGIAVVIFAAFPLVYVFSASLNPGGTLITANTLFGNLSLRSYVDLFNLPRQPFAAWYVNTLFIGFSASAGSVMLGALAAYAFSRMRFTGRRFGLITILLVQMFPQLLAMVAIFLLMLSIGEIFPAIGLNSQIGLIMVYLGGALGVNTYLMYGFFNTIPVSIDEAARIDGAGHARIFFTIILPLVSPILAVVALLSLVATLSEFVIASVLLRDPEKQTLAVGLYQFISQETSQNWSIFAAGAVLAAIIPVALFLGLQRYIVSGLVAGSVK